jgi:hypothetical protein
MKVRKLIFTKGIAGPISGATYWSGTARWSWYWHLVISRSEEEREPELVIIEDGTDKSGGNDFRERSAE